MKLRNPLKPLTPPADNAPAPKPIVPVKPVVTPRKPPGKRRFSTFLLDLFLVFKHLILLVVQL